MAILNKNNSISSYSKDECEKLRSFLYLIAEIEVEALLSKTS
jgi:hypothetical protein